MRASENSLLSVGYAINTKHFDFVANRFGFRCHGGRNCQSHAAAVAPVRRPAPRHRAVLGHVRGERFEGAYDGTEGAIVVFERVPGAGEFFGKAGDVGRFGSAKAVDRLSLISYDPDARTGAGDRA